MSSSRLSIELFNFLLRGHPLIHLLRTYLLNTCHVQNPGLGAQGRNSRIRSLALGAHPLGAYSLQRKEEEKSSEVLAGGGWKMVKMPGPLSFGYLHWVQFSARGLWTSESITSILLQKKRKRGAGFVFILLHQFLHLQFLAVQGNTRGQARLDTGARGWPPGPGLRVPEP